MKTSPACFGLFSLTIITIVVSSVMNGWVLSILWGWFISPIFNVPNISVLAAIGLSLVAGMLTTSNSSDGEKRKDTTDLIATVLSRAVISPLLTLFIGYIVNVFIR